jgi:hypothetical protein
MSHGTPDKMLLSRELHLLYVSYSFTAFVTSAIYLGLFLYAYSHDPWLTPRWTHYMIVWWKAGRPLFDLFTILVPGGVIILLASSNLRKRWGIWCSVVVMIAVVFGCGVP